MDLHWVVLIYGCSQTAKAKNAKNNPRPRLTRKTWEQALQIRCPVVSPTKQLSSIRNCKRWCLWASNADDFTISNDGWDPPRSWLVCSTSAAYFHLNSNLLFCFFEFTRCMLVTYLLTYLPATVLTEAIYLNHETSINRLCKFGDKYCQPKFLGHCSPLRQKFELWNDVTHMRQRLPFLIQEPQRQVLEQRLESYCQFPTVRNHYVPKQSKQSWRRY